MALDMCGSFEKKVVMTGRSNGATGGEFVGYLMDTMKDASLRSRWEKFQQGA